MMQSRKLLGVLSATILLGMGSTALGQEVNCKLMNISNRYITYKTVAVFPKPSESVVIDLSDGKPVPDALLSKCGYKVVNAKDYVTVKFDSKETFIIDVVLLDTYIYNYFETSPPKYHSIKVYMDVSRQLKMSAFAISDGKFQDEFYARKTFREQLAGYKLNNGPLLPAYFEGEFHELPKLSDNDVIDIYATDVAPSNNIIKVRLPRITYDFSKNTVTLWRTFPFPEK